MRCRIITSGQSRRCNNHWMPPGLCSHSHRLCHRSVSRSITGLYPSWSISMVWCVWKCVRRSQHLRNIASAVTYWWLSATANLSISSYCLWCFLSNLIEVVRLAPGFAFQDPVAGMVSHASLLLAVSLTLPVAELLDQDLEVPHLNLWLHCCRR